MKRIQFYSFVLLSVAVTLLLSACGADKVEVTTLSTAKTGSHTGARPAVHMQLKKLANANATGKPICKVYNTDGGFESAGGAPRFGAGNFRVSCQYSHFSYDDPILKPGQQGAAHLHMFFGKTNADYNTNKDNIASSGGGTCNGFALNRSAYWTPALLNKSGKGRHTKTNTCVLQVLTC